MDCSGLYLICEAIKISESESLNSTETGNKKRKNSNEDKILTRKKRTPLGSIENTNKINNCSESVDYDKIIKYALNKVKDLFTLNEIKESIFDNKFNRNKSKKRKPFDTKRTKLLKNSIASIFTLTQENTEIVWQRIRPELNIKIYNLNYIKKVVKK